MLFLLATLAAIHPATPRAGADWISPNDYPPAALRKNEFGYVGFSVLVGPDGKPEKCDVTAPTAFNDLNDLSCSLVMRRGRFKPAAGPDGNPAYGIFRSWASWMVADDLPMMQRLAKLYPRPSEIDLTLFVKATIVPPPVNLVIGVDATGAIVECDAQQASVSPNIAKVACEQVRTHWRPLLGLTKAGQAVTTVQSVKIGFQAQDTSAPAH
jgi:hypothetical protein